MPARDIEVRTSLVVWLRWRSTRSDAVFVSPRSLEGPGAPASEEPTKSAAGQRCSKFRECWSRGEGEGAREIHARMGEACINAPRNRRPCVQGSPPNGRPRGEGILAFWALNTSIASQTSARTTLLAGPSRRANEISSVGIGTPSAMGAMGDTRDRAAL